MRWIHIKAIIAYWFPVLNLYQLSFGTTAMWIVQRGLQLKISKMSTMCIWHDYAYVSWCWCQNHFFWLRSYLFCPPHLALISMSWIIRWQHNSLMLCNVLWHFPVWGAVFIHAWVPNHQSLTLVRWQILLYYYVQFITNFLAIQNSLAKTLTNIWHKKSAINILRCAS